MIGFRAHRRDIVMILLKGWQLVKTVIDASAAFIRYRLMSYIQTRKFIIRVNLTSQSLITF